MKPGILALFVVLGVASLGLAPPACSLALTAERGAWPDSWPGELEPLRNQSRTLQIATGIQEDVYEIFFHDQSRFESLWPSILSLKSPGAPLRLSRVGPESRDSLLSQARPAVRIYAPTSVSVGLGGAAGEAMAKLDEEMLRASPEQRKGMEREFARIRREQEEQGATLRTGPPWPDSILSENGLLPEYVSAEKVDGKMKWVPVERGENPAGFLYRARIEIELITDGDVIDLNRIPLPPDTSIIDQRFEGGLNR